MAGTAIFGPVCRGQPLQPGIFVRGEHGKWLAGLGQYLVAVEYRLVLARLEGDAYVGQSGRDRRVAPLGSGFVVTVGIDRRNAKFAGECGNFVNGAADPDDQSATPGAQSRVQFEQRFTDEMHAPVTS